MIGKQQRKIAIRSSFIHISVHSLIQLIKSHSMNKYLQKELGLADVYVY